MQLQYLSGTVNAQRALICGYARCRYWALVWGGILTFLFSLIPSFRHFRIFNIIGGPRALCWLSMCCRFALVESQWSS